MEQEQQVINKYKLELLKEEGFKMFGERGKFAYDSWEQINRLYFDDELTPIPIIWGITNYSKSAGNINNGRMMLHNSIYKPKSEKVWKCDAKWFGKKYVYDVILHEAIHHKIRLNGGYKDNFAVSSSHNNPQWIDEIIRIGSLLGYDIKAEIVRQKRINGEVSTYVKEGYLTRKEIAGFPHTVRPEGYYLD